MITELLSILVDRVPDDLFPLCISWENICISSYFSLWHLYENIPINFILSGSSMPYLYCSFPSIAKELHYWLLIFSIVYVMREWYLHYILYVVFVLIKPRVFVTIILYVVLFLDNNLNLVVFCTLSRYQLILFESRFSQTRQLCDCNRVILACYHLSDQRISRGL